MSFDTETSSIDPMRALYVAAVVNGVLAPPLMIVLMLMATNPRVMGHLTISRRLAAMGWIAAAVMIGVVLMFALA